MRKSDLRKNHETLDQAIIRYYNFLEKIIAAQRVIATAEEKRDLAESVILRLCANWERFVDNQLVSCVNRDPSKLSEFLGVKIPAHPDKGLCQALLYGDTYRDFRSFGDLKGFSKKVLPEDGNPFICVSRAHGNRLDEVYKIRNYLAHYSDRARRSLFNMYKSSHNMNKFLEPGQFLLAYEGRRLWAYIDTFANVSADMKDWYDGA
jgi:hypothetical protein